MTKDILIKDTARERIGTSIEDVLKEVKSTTRKIRKTKSGIRVKHLKNLLILF